MTSDSLHINWIMKRSMWAIISLLISAGILPVLAQPAESYSAVEDAYVYLGGDKAGQTFGTLDPNVLVSRTSVASAQYTREAYVMFDITGHAGYCSEAVLKLYGNVLEAKRVEVYTTDEPWQEETLTGNNRPTGSYVSFEAPDAGEGYVSWDVTLAINEAIDRQQIRITFILKDIAGAVSTLDTKWHSKENPSGNVPTLLLTQGDPPVIYQGNYYIDQVNGNDANSGHSPDEAWKTLRNIEGLILQPGDSLLFKSGGIWTGTMSPRGSGVPGKPIVIGKYGGDVRPQIHGAGLSTNTIFLKDQHHIVLRDLAITNKGIEGELKRGVYYEAGGLGSINYLVFDNLEVYDVNGNMEEKDNGGIYLEIKESFTPTWFDTLIISNCHVYDVNRTGISNRSFWDRRSIYENHNWVPSKNVHIHHNLFERTGANALIVRAAHKPIMEYNKFSHCAILGSGNASFSFNTDSAIWQYNEASFTKYNDGDNDAGGFDSDYRSFHTIIQYNYSHNNEYGGILVTGGPGSGDGFNDGTIVRYNIFANNKHHIIRTSGNVTNTKIYNNLFYTGPELDNVMQLYHKSWGRSYSDETYYWNNIFYNEGSNSSFDIENSTNNEFMNNIFYGNSYIDLPSDPIALYDDPLLLNPDDAYEGFEGAMQYQLTEGSPAVDRGVAMDTTVKTDFAGTLIPQGSSLDIGPIEFIPSGIITDTTFVRSLKNQLKLAVYPNPASQYVNVELTGSLSGRVEIMIFDLKMSLMTKHRVSKSGFIFFDRIDVQSLCSGIYVLQIVSETQTIQAKLIVE